MPEVVDISQRHKQDMTDVIASLLPVSQNQKYDAQALAVAVDGAIIRAQFDRTPEAALSSIDRIQKALLGMSK
ncbi:hypothetical protein SFSGTM_12910 [Sulfuriferula nivalis]|uniref:Uncharacterized protein n=2 Tax=Sulfuriferula nivalis TaxID=2675298 RepID=A0A809S8J7_9PROT|nr:hypothetical protein SFSGTM_12910 [Sulfuriferula nivalis]